MRRRLSRLTLRTSLSIILAFGAMTALLGSAVPLVSSWTHPTKKSSFKLTSSGVAHVRLSEPRELQPVYSEIGSDIISIHGARGSQVSQGQPLSLSSGDLDSDGIPDLICGFANGSGGMLTLQRGNREAFAPKAPASLDGIIKGEYPNPFLNEAKTLSLPEAPDFLVTGDFNRDGALDVIAAARLSQSAYLVPGDRKGGFGEPQIMRMPGSITAILSDDVNERDGQADLIVCVKSESGASLLVFDTSSNLATATPSVHALPGTGESLAAGDLDGDRARDIAIAAAGRVFVLHGRKQLSGLDRLSLDPKAGQLEAIDLPYSVKTLTAGDFIADRNNRTELALVSEDGGVHIAARGQLDVRRMTAGEIQTARKQMSKLRKQAEKSNQRGSLIATRQPERLKWESIEDLAGAGSSSSHFLIAARMSGQSTDDLLTMDSASHTLRISSRPESRSAEVSLQSARRGSLDIESDDEIAATAPMRVGADGRPGLVVLRKGKSAPVVFTPQANNTFVVNTANDTDDAVIGDGVCADAGGDCSLRAAIQEANFDVTNDTITFASSLNGVPIQLTQTGNDSNADQGDLDINSDITIVGNGAANTIIQGADDANFTNATGDKIFAINPDGIFNGLTVSITGVTIRFARNTVPFGDPSFAYTGGGIDAFLTGTGNSISLTDCTIDRNANAFSYGGGVNIDSFTFGSSGGTVTFSGCTISNNQLQEASASQSGAGVNLFADNHDVVITNCTISGNDAQNNCIAAGINIRHTNGGTITINGTDVTNNTAGSHSGGIQTSFSQIVNMDSGNVTGNSSGGDGGGINASGGTITLSNLTISGNTAASSGGGLFVTQDSLNVSLSRIAGNSAPAGSGIAQTGGTATVENNWWGCDGFPNAAGCQTGSGTFDADPRIDLRLLPTSATLVPGGSQVFTADVSKNTDGVTINPVVLNGLTVTFGNTAGLGNVSPGSAVITSLIASTTFTANSTCPSPNTGTVSATLDNGTQTSAVSVEENIVLTACPANIVVNNDPNQCSASVTFTAPTATAGCPTPTVTCKVGATPITSPHTFPVGTTTVTCTASNGSSPDQSCSFTVTVNDTQPPTIGSCPSNITTDDNPPGSGSATVTYSTPSGNDNCPGVVVNCAPPSGSSFPVGTTTVTCTATDASSNTASCQFTVTVNSAGLTALSPARMWIGLKNSDDVGTKFDLLAEVLKNGTVVGSGQLNDIPGGSSGFNNAVLRTITLALSSSVGFTAGDTLSFRLSVRVAATSGHNSGTARLWYNGAAIDSGASRDAGSRFGATIAGSSADYFLRTGFTLNTTAGSSRTSVDKLVSNSGGNPWVAFGTWSKTF